MFAFKDINTIDLVAEVAGVRRYVLAKGWTEEYLAPDDVAVYRKQGQHELVLPLDPTYADFRERVLHVVKKIAVLDQKPFETLLYELLLPVSDVVRFRRDDYDTRLGTISMNTGVEFYAGLKKAMLASARTAIKPKSYYTQLAGSEADLFISKCRFGQTEYGSYVTSVICPIEQSYVDADDPQGSLLPEQERSRPIPFARQVTQTFARSVAHIVGAIDDKREASLLEPRSGDLIVSANLCEALIEMAPEGSQSSLYITTQWADILTPSTDMPEQIVVDGERHYSAIRDLVKALKPSSEPKRAEYIGRVEGLRGKVGENRRRQGKIDFVFTAEGRAIKSTVLLDPDSYEEACDAHKLNLYVSIIGMLRQYNERTFLLEDVSNFAIVQRPLPYEVSDVETSKS